jgi:alpha-L-fucosidase
MLRYWTEQQRIEILLLRGCDDMKRTLDQVCEIFNNKYPDDDRITKSTVSKIEKIIAEFGNVKDRPRGRPAVQENLQLNLLLELQDNPHTTTRALAANHDISKTSVIKYLKRLKFHPYKLMLVQELKIKTNLIAGWNFVQKL